jgi:hypothetical protein
MSHCLRFLISDSFPEQKVMTQHRLLLHQRFIISLISFHSVWLSLTWYVIPANTDNPCLFITTSKYPIYHLSYDHFLLSQITMPGFLLNSPLGNVKATALWQQEHLASWILPPGVESFGTGRHTFNAIPMWSHSNQHGRDIPQCCRGLLESVTAASSKALRWQNLSRQPVAKLYTDRICHGSQ